MQTRTLYRTAFQLGVVSSGGILLAHLALTDIFHGEADLTLEWNLLRVAFVAIIAFHVAGIAALRRALRHDASGTAAETQAAPTRV